MAYSTDTDSEDWVAAKYLYDTTGSISNISNTISYLSNKGYTSDEIAEKLNTSDAEYSLTGTDIDNLLDQINNAGSYENSYSTISYGKDSILGLPFRWNYMTDPGRRTYNRTFMRDSSVMTIIPGLPKYRGSDSSIVNAAGESFFQNNDTAEDSESFINNSAFGLGANPDVDSTVYNWLLANQKNTSITKNKDLRYYGFDPQMKEFLSYFELVMNTVGVKMGLIGGSGLATMSSFNSYVNQNFGSGSFKFYIAKNASLSETMDNSFSDSAIASSAKTLSDISKEAMFLMGKTGNITSNEDLNTIWGVDTDNGFGKTLSDTIDSAKKLINGNDDSGVVTEIFDNLRAAVNGINMVYPQIWKESSYNRSVNVSFNFESPYGTPQAIFEYVYIPFLLLYTLAAPRQIGINGVTSPFLVKVDVPGFFTSDLAVIDSFSFKKGGDSGLYNKDGLPLAISCEVSFKDLYVAAMVPNKYEMLRVNEGIHGFLDNMAGLSVERWSPLEDIKNSLKIRAAYTLGQVEHSFSRSASDWLYRISRNVTQSLSY